MSSSTPTAPPPREYGGARARTPAEPAWHDLSGRRLDADVTRLRDAAFAWIEPYYDRDHLTRAGDWLLALTPDAPDHLLLAALTHDMERSVPGGPKLEMAEVGWDDRTYNDAHTHRSADVVSSWLADQGASPALCQAVRVPIQQHEFGGSPEGDLMQAADSISFLETNAPLVASWAMRGMCTHEKAREKLEWMGARVRLPAARDLARTYCQQALSDFEALTTPRSTDV